MRLPSTPRGSHVPAASKEPPHNNARPRGVAVTQALTRCTATFVHEDESIAIELRHLGLEVLPLGSYVRSVALRRVGLLFIRVISALLSTRLMVR